MERINYQRHDNMRIALSILSIILLSAFTGSSVAMRFSGWMTPPVKASSSLFLAVGTDRQSSAPSQETVNAITTEQINELSKGQSEDKDDRKLLHDQIYQLSQTETNHYNTMMNRLDVDEARLNSYGAVVGGGVVLLNGLALFIQISDRRRKKTPVSAT